MGNMNGDKEYHPPQNYGTKDMGPRTNLSQGA